MCTTNIQDATRRLEDLARSAPARSSNAAGSTINRFLDRTPLIDGLLAVLINALADDMFATPSTTTASSRFEDLMRTLDEPEMQAALRHDDPLGPAWIRGMCTRQALLQAEGGVCSATEMARLLGVTRQRVDHRRRQRTLIGVNLGRRGYRYPVWQMGVAGLDVALQAMHDFGPWMHLGFMLSHNAVLENETPLAVLRRGDVARVLEAVDLIGEQVAA